MWWLPIVVFAVAACLGVITRGILEEFAEEFLKAFSTFHILAVSVLVVILELWTAFAYRSQVEVVFISGVCFTLAMIFCLVALTDLSESWMRAKRYLKTGTTMKPFGSSVH